jgi:hypothetical protein
VWLHYEIPQLPAFVFDGDRIGLLVLMGIQIRNRFLKMMPVLLDPNVHHLLFLSPHLFAYSVYISIQIIRFNIVTNVTLFVSSIALHAYDTHILT